GEPGAPEGGGGGGDRADAHPFGADTGDRPGTQREQGLPTAAFRLGAGGDQAHGGAVVLAAGVARGHGGVGVQPGPYGAQRGEVPGGGAGARVLVGVDDAFRCAAGGGHGD